jgi:RHS repeat-associated protein
MRDVPSGSGTVYYVLVDHLGSSSSTLHADGTPLQDQRIKYWPYGGKRSGGMQLTDKKYTGQRHEEPDGFLELYNYKARFYSTTLGRFVSADSRPDGLNRFAYASNNPINLVDPNGETANIACGTGNPCTGGGDGIEPVRNLMVRE